MSTDNNSAPSSRGVLSFAGITPILLSIAYFANSNSQQEPREVPVRPPLVSSTVAQAPKDSTPDLQEILRQHWDAGPPARSNPGGFKLNLELLIFTLPDPEFRALAPMTDSLLAAFQLGLRDAKYLPISIGPIGWPRIPSSKEETADLNQRTSRTKPGVWLFHRVGGRAEAPNILAVLLVGEDPVGGVNRPQLRSALEQIKGTITFPHTSTSEPMMLAPTFSGGAQSLHDEVIKYQSLCFRSASATASNPDLVKLLNHGTISWRQRANKNPLSQALTILKDKLHVPCHEIAILSEAHTLYGGGGAEDSVEKPCPPRDNYSFLPRDLYALRVAVNEDPKLFDRIFPSSKSKGGIRVPLKPSSGAGGMPAYAGETMAKSQEVTLDAFAKRLKSEHIRYLGILTTDRLDSLFLARYLTEESPNLRIFLVGSDALFNAGVSRGSLTGVLTFSPYPVGIVSKNTMPSVSDIAAQVTKTTTELVDPTSEDSSQQKRLFASVIGRGGEWPLASYTEGGGDSTPSAKEYRIPHFRTGPLFGFVATLVLLTSIPVLRFLYSLLGIEAWPSEYLRRLAPYAGVPAGFRAFCKDLWQHVRDSEVRASSGGARKLLFRFLKDREVKGREAKRCVWLAVLFATTVVLWLALAFFVYQINYGQEKDIRWWRLQSLTNGVNPLIPLVCYLCALYSLIWMRVRGRYIDNYTFNVLPAHRNKSSLVLGNDACLESKLKAELEEGFSLVGLCTFLVLTLILVNAYDLWLRDVWPIYRGFPWGDQLWTFLAVLTTATVLATLVKTSKIWLLLHNELIALEAHPIRNAFSRLPDRLSWTSIWSLNGLQPQFLSLQLAQDFITVLNQRPKYRSAFDASFMRPSQKVLDAIYGLQFPCEEETNLSDLQHTERAAQKICGHYSTRLEPLWTMSRLEGWRNKAGDPKLTEKAGLFWAGGLRGINENTWDANDKLAEEFIALMYASYIRYVFMQMRNIAGALAVSISMLFLASYSYPFHPKGALANSVTFLFVCLALMFTSIFYQMDRDPLLSRLSETEAGKLDSGFFKRMLQFGLLPTLTFLASQVPELADALLRVVEIIPGLPK